MANVLKALGAKRGDRVTIYMPMIPEAAYAMLACARIGAVHSVVFGGFSAESLRDRIGARPHPFDVALGEPYRTALDQNGWDNGWQASRELQVSEGDIDVPDFLRGR